MPRPPNGGQRGSPEGGLGQGQPPRRRIGRLDSRTSGTRPESRQPIAPGVPGAPGLRWVRVDQAAISRFPAPNVEKGEGSVTSLISRIKYPKSSFPQKRESITPENKPHQVPGRLWTPAKSLPSILTEGRVAGCEVRNVTWDPFSAPNVNVFALIRGRVRHDVDTRPTPPDDSVQR